MGSILYKLSSPKSFYDLAGKLIPWLSLLAIVVFFYGSIQGLFIAPPDYQQGYSVRIMYFHVPSAMLSLFVYTIIALLSLIGFIWHLKMAHILAKSSAIIGASFTLITLVTGSIWGKAMWGTWWEWDARLTSELILLFLYFGYIALHNAFDEFQKADRAAGLLAIVGVINIPIIHFSVTWWNTLHQGPSISKLGASTIHPSLLYPLYGMIVAFLLTYLVILLIRARNEILAREQRSQWVRNMLFNTAGDK